MQGLVVPAKVVAACFALAAFALAVVAGLAAGNPATTILGCAIVSMLVCHAVGYVVGIVAERTIAERVDEYRAQHPIPHAGGTPPCDIAVDEPGIEDGM